MSPTRSKAATRGAVGVSGGSLLAFALAHTDEGSGHTQSTNRLSIHTRLSGAVVPVGRTSGSILIILAGVKPLERRAISVKQERSIHLLAEPGSVSLDGVHNALGA